MKNRIQMLEKAIIDSGVATRLDLGISRPTATENDGASSESQSFFTPSSDGEAALESGFQNMGPWDFDPSPDPVDEANFFTSQDFFETWNQPDFALVQETSYLSTPDSTRQSNGSVSNDSHQISLPWQEPSTSQVQTSGLILSPNGTDLENYQGANSQPRKEYIDSKSTRGRPNKSSSTEGSNEVRLHPCRNLRYNIHKVDAVLAQESPYNAKEGTGSKREDNSFLERRE